ncbi:MAG: DNA-3-methyladenine glycosylase 2 family protein [Halieaceae bacterium]
MATRYRFALTSAHIKKALTELADRHKRVAMSLEHVGYPSERRQPHGFEPLARIVVGQQVSTKAAESIAEKLRLTLGGTISAEAVLSTETDTLRSAGLSGQKASYIQTLAEAVVTNTLDLEALPRLNDDDALKQLTALRGFGMWSAQMYLMFSLGRTDIWPSGDLAVRVGFGDLMGFDERLSIKDTDNLAAPFAPYRSALALLCWRYYGQAKQSQIKKHSPKTGLPATGPAKKGPAKKAPVKKAPVKKAPFKKVPAKSDEATKK